MTNFIKVIVNGNAKFAPLYGLLKIIPSAKSKTGEAETATAFKNTSIPIGIWDLDNPNTNPIRTAINGGLRMIFLKVSAMDKSWVSRKSNKIIVPAKRINPSIVMIDIIGLAYSCPNKVSAIGKTNKTWLVKAMHKPIKAASLVSLRKMNFAIRNPVKYRTTSVKK